MYVPFLLFYVKPWYIHFFFYSSFQIPSLVILLLHIHLFLTLFQSFPLSRAFAPQLFFRPLSFYALLSFLFSCRLLLLRSLFFTIFTCSLFSCFLSYILI
jgi:hypothetical protein